MAQSVIKNVKTHSVGFVPILGHYFNKCGIQRIIDEQVFLDPRRKVLTHGQAAVAMITTILFQVMQLYRICRFASEKKVLDVILPQITPEQYFDDRLADTEVQRRLSRRSSQSEDGKLGFLRNRQS